MTLLLLVSSISSVYACSCAEPSYTEEDAGHALANFMENKLGVPSVDLRALNGKYIGGYLTAADKLMLKLSLRRDYAGNTQHAGYLCDVSCSEAQNSIYDYHILYTVDEDQLCELKLKVYMESNLTNSGYKSKVKKNMHPVCESL